MVTFVFPKTHCPQAISHQAISYKKINLNIHFSLHVKFGSFIETIFFKFFIFFAFWNYELLLNTLKQYKITLFWLFHREFTKFNKEWCASTRMNLKFKHFISWFLSVYFMLNKTHWLKSEFICILVYINRFQLIEILNKTGALVKWITFLSQEKLFDLLLRNFFY